MNSSGRQSDPSLARAAWWPTLIAGLSLSYGLVLVILRGEPSVRYDGGIFLSVAARMLDGDRLYAEVFDNKDPLFFYVDAAVLRIGGWRAPFLLDAVWLGLSACSFGGLLRAVGGSRATAVAGFVAYPLLLTGAWYVAGYSMLGALSLAPLIAWLWARGRCGWAGVALGAALLFKINLALLLLAAPAVVLLLPERRDRLRPDLARGGLGLGATLGSAAVFLAARGELAPYLQTLSDNVAYSTNVLGYTGRKGGISGHVDYTVGQINGLPDVFGIPRLWAILAVLAVVGVVALRSLLGSESRQSLLLAALGGFFLTSSAATILTLVLTAAWRHHLQMLAYPGAFLVALVVAWTEAALRDFPLRLLTGTCAVAFGVFLLGGTKPQYGVAGSRTRWTIHVTSSTAMALEQARLALRLDRVSYAHLGRNDEEGHAAFLSGPFDLACAKFHQYVFTADLDGVLRCIRRNHPDLVAVTATFAPRDDVDERWNRFVTSGRELLRRSYEPVLRRATLDGPVEVWAPKPIREDRSL